MEKTRAEAGEKNPVPTLSELPEKYPDHWKVIQDRTGGKSIEEVMDDLADQIAEAHKNKKSNPEELSPEELEEKVQNGQLLVICPHILEATTRLEHKPQAVNYTLRWDPTIRLGEEEVGCWYSQRQERGFTKVFDELMKQKKDSGAVTWEASGFYFTHSDGMAARERYEEMVLEGEVKANAKSWRNKHSIFTGTTFDELEEMYPDLYKTTSKKEEEEAEEVTITDEEVIDVTEDIEREIEAEEAAEMTDEAEVEEEELEEVE